MAGNLGKTRPGAGYTPKGSQRQRRRRKEVAGPYRSQSSVPSIRAEATPGEHRSAASTVRGARAEQAASRRADQAVHSILSRVNLPTQPADPRSTLEYARVTGDIPPVGPTLPELQETQPRLARLTEKEQLANLAEHENLGEPADLTNAILLASGIGEVGTLLKGAGQIGVKELAGEAAATGAKQIAGTAEANSLARALGGLAGKKAAVRGAVGKAAAKVEPTLLRDARQAVGRGAARAAEKVPKPVRVAGGIGGRAVAAPVKHPFTAPLALQAPAAAIHGDPGEFVKALEGKGTLASISGTVGSGAASALPGTVGQIANEAVNLPAVILPSVFLPAKAGVEAAGGDSAALDKLWNEYLETGLLPKVFSGDASGALGAIKEHPLYSGLEASGLASAAGRTVGGAARTLSDGRVLGRARPGQTIEGYPNIRVEREFSPDAFRQIAQRLHERRTGNVIRPGTGHRFTPTLERSGDRAFRKAVVRDAGDRFNANSQDAQRLGRQEMLEAANELAPRKRGLNRLRKVAPRTTLDNASADVVVHAIERTIRHPETFHEDLTSRLHELDAIAKEHYDNGLPVLDRAELKANREMAAHIEKALKSANPEHVVHAANAFIETLKPITAELIDRGILHPDQAERAGLIPFARIHMGAGHDEEHGLVDQHGNPLSNEAIQAEMQRHGIEPPGFISHRAGTRGDFWGPTNERGSLPKGTRTGAAALRGTYESGFEGVLRQLVRSRGLLERVKTWDEFITRFGMLAHGIKVDSMAVAQKVVRDPARYGLNPNITWRPVRRQPFTAMKSEIDAALEHQDPSIAAEPFLSKALDTATSEHGPEGDIVFMPAGIVKNMEENFRPLSPALKAAQLSTTGLKRAVLPFSPSYYFGNAIDNAIRTALAGVGPQHFIAGYQLSKELPEEKKAQLLGSAYSSVDKLAARRTHEDFADSALEGAANAAAAFRHSPGPKQLIDLVLATSHALLAVNAKLTERLPQYGALGKIAMQDVRNVQGQWAGLLHLQAKYVEDVVKGLDNSDTMIRYQKGMEDIYGNWSRMSPHARKFLTNFFPFWTWSRAALKLVYKTLPAHHPIQTALLTAAARMTQTEREKLGLDLLAKEPLPNFLQGGIPIRGSIAPWGKYTSFGYAGHPLESIATGVLPTLREQLQAAEGRDWKGDPLGGSELSHLGTALEGGLGTYIPGYNTVEGLLGKGLGYLSPVHVEPPDALPYLRSLSESQTITVPKSGGGSSSSAPWRSGPSESGKAPWR